MVRDCTYAGAGMGYGAMPGPECWTLVLVLAYAHAGLAKMMKEKDQKERVGDPAVAGITAQLTGHPSFLESLCRRAESVRWCASRERFAEHLARSAAAHFKVRGAEGSAGEAVAWEQVGNYLAALHLEDFALACGCMEGNQAAWEFFVREYRGYLRRCAGTMLRRGAESAEAQELADSMFAELYGLAADGRRGMASLLRYFHGRSSLKTWLRAVLAQRHVDGIRASRRLEALEEEDGTVRHAAEQGADASGSGNGSGKNSAGSLSNSRQAVVGPLAVPADPYREKYLGLFCGALQGALGELAAEDHRRVCLYYAEGKRLAEVGRICGEHESSVSRNLERIRRELRERVGETLRDGEGGLSDAQIALCFQYATEDAPIDFRVMFPGDATSTQPKLARSGAGEEES
jgi:RNA polymerase sigma factor (sigma-70 family)